MTTVALFHFPGVILWETRVSWEITSQLVGGGQTAAGVSPVTRIDGGGAWKMTMEEIPLAVEDARRAWRSVSAICDGGSNPMVIPFRVPPEVPYPTVSAALLTSYSDIPHTDNVLFESGVGYQVGTIDATLSVAAEIGETNIVIDIAYGGDLEGGEHFSIDHPVLRYRLYRIRTVKDNGDGTWNVSIRPGLRADTPADTKLNFDHPKCVMRLLTGNAMDATFEGVWVSRPTVSFIEAFPPFPEPA
jgi:hypothetical protein